MRAFVGWWVVGCGSFEVPEGPPGPEIVEVPPLPSGPGDSGDGLAPQGPDDPLPARSFGCLPPSVALGQLGGIDAIPLEPWWGDEAAVCLWLDTRPTCDSVALPKSLFQRAAVRVTDAAATLLVCASRSVECRGEVTPRPGLSSIRDECDGEWVEQIALRLDAREPAVVQRR